MEPNMNQNPNSNPYPPYAPPPSQQTYSQPPYGQYQPPVNSAKPSGMAIASMVLGICSILFCAGVFTGLICAILAIVFASKAAKQAPQGNLNPNRGFVKAGKICGIIGLVLSILFVVFWVIYIILLVTLLQDVLPQLSELTPYLNGSIDIQISATSL